VKTRHCDPTLVHPPLIDPRVRLKLRVHLQRFLRSTRTWPSLEDYRWYINTAKCTQTAQVIEGLGTAVFIKVDTKLPGKGSSDWGRWAVVSTLSAVMVTIRVADFDKSGASSLGEFGVCRCADHRELPAPLP
jgi:hypothetical protein